MGPFQCPTCLLRTPEASSVCIHCGSAIARTHVVAPLLSVEESNMHDDEQVTPPPFFAVSLPKLSVLSICTLGIYDLYWFYKNWQRIRVRSEPGISPFWRAFFAVIFCYPCFARIKVTGASMGIKPVPPFGVLAILWMIFSMAWRLPGGFFFLCFLKVGFLLPVQAFANRINRADAPRYKPNSRFSVWNWIAIVLGGSVIVLDVIALILPTR